MPRLPRLYGAAKERVVTEVFSGYNHNLKIGDGELYDTENLTTACYPMLANRPKRGLLDRTFTDLRAVIAKEALCWVDGGTLYVNGAATALTGLQTARETRLVSMGAYICVFPDAKFYNTLDPSDYGSMGARWDYTGRVDYAMCRADGTVYEQVTVSETEPESPQNGDVWVDADGAARLWSEFDKTWTALETVYTRVTFTSAGQLPAAFREYDGVEITGLRFPALNGSKILYAVGGGATESDYLVLVGICAEAVSDESAAVTVRRTVPPMDFVCEAQNRLWGCFYGNDGEKNVNELFCCALGDFRNWNQYLGLSTDSWRAGCGSDGKWTGCVNYMGSPVFFKENTIHQIGVSPVGAHTVGELPARGVQAGSHKSLAVVSETLYYKSRGGVMAWQGGMPADVGAALGSVPYYEAAAGVFDKRYYISMRDGAGTWSLFCFDTGTGLWMREDDLHAAGFAAWGDELYAMSGDRVVALNGTVGTPEETVHFSAETGVLHYRVTGRKYVSRFNLRVKLGAGARLRLWLEYDSSGLWEPGGEVTAAGLDSFVLPVRPRRCDHLRLKLEGEGEIRVFSMARVLEEGSDM